MSKIEEMVEWLVEQNRLDIVPYDALIKARSLLKEEQEQKATEDEILHPLITYPVDNIPITELSISRGIRLRGYRNEKHIWGFSLRGRDTRKVISAPTYAEAESEARAYLNTLPDVKEAK